MTIPSETEMIISETGQFVFIHNPKAGGTSVRSSLLPWDTRNNFFWGITLDQAARWNVDKAHLPLHVLRRLYPEERQLMDRYFIFGFTRHPLKRFISAFNERFPDVFQGLAADSVSQDEYAAKVQAYADKVIAGGRWNPSFTHATPQVPLFFEGKKCVADLLIPIEEAEQRSAALVHLLGPPGQAVFDCFSGKTAKKNVRQMSQSPDQLLSPQIMERLRQFYEEDFLVLGYL